MSFLYSCSTCCTILSVWGMFQLLIMGICYKLEVTVLIEDVEAEDNTYGDYDEFIKMTSDNYSAMAINCWIVSAIYMVTLVLSCIGLHVAKRQDKKAAVRRDDDEYSCQPKKEKK